MSRLSEAWQAEHERWQRRSLAAVDYVYLWADGVHFTVRLEEDRLCCLVLAGVWPYVVVPYRLTETPLRVTAPAPCLGEHSARSARPPRRRRRRRATRSSCAAASAARTRRSSSG